MVEGFEAMLEVLNGRPVCTLCGSLGPRLSKKLHSTVPLLGAKRMMGEPIDMFNKRRGMETFKGVGDAGMKRAAAVRQQGVVGYLVDQAVLESVLQIRE